MKDDLFLWCGCSLSRIVPFGRGGGSILHVKFILGPCIKSKLKGSKCSHYLMFPCFHLLEDRPAASPWWRFYFLCFPKLHGNTPGVFCKVQQTTAFRFLCKWTCYSRQWCEHAGANSNLVTLIIPPEFPSNDCNSALETRTEIVWESKRRAGQRW